MATTRLACLFLPPSPWISSAGNVCAAHPLLACGQAPNAACCGIASTSYPLSRQNGRPARQSIPSKAIQGFFAAFSSQRLRFGLQCFRWKDWRALIGPFHSGRCGRPFLRSLRCSTQLGRDGNCRIARGLQPIRGASPDRTNRRLRGRHSPRKPHIVARFQLRYFWIENYIVASAIALGAASLV